jgi:putative ABC transport system permease protein
MTPVDSVWSALDSLRANLLRTVLTTLGIVIGVAAVIAMVGVGRAAEQRVQSVMQNLGANIMIVLNGTSTSGGVRRGSGSKPSLTIGDADAIVRELSAVQAAAPSVRGTGQAVYGNTNWFTSIQGVREDYLPAREWGIASGVGIEAADDRGARKVAVIGRTVVEKLFGAEDPIGQTIRVQRVPFTVIGVLATKGQTTWGADQDDVIFIPLSTAMKRVLGGRQVRGDYVHSITVKAVSGDRLADAERDVTTLLRQRHRIQNGQPDDFFIRNITQFLEARAEQERTMGFLLASVAGVSLLVGGIGIMNIMLVSVTERTREIGLRMAVGARARDILSQFVIEAVTLSLAGGMIGVALGVAGSVAASEIAGWSLAISPGAILIAVAFSAGVGIFFGWYPALKASRLDPIEALRHA